MQLRQYARDPTNSADIASFTEMALRDRSLGMYASPQMAPSPLNASIMVSNMTFELVMAKAGMPTVI